MQNQHPYLFSGIGEIVTHFFIADRLFMRVFRNPMKYIPFLKSCSGVIGTDVSQNVDMPQEMRFRHAWCNATMSKIFQNEGVNLYPNITWSIRDSFSYSFPYCRDIKESDKPMF